VTVRAALDSRVRWRPASARKIAAVLALIAVPALGQEKDAKDPVRAEKLVGVAFRFRHDGLFDQSAAAFDAAIQVYPEGPDRRAAQLDAHELAVVEGKFDRAARIAHGWDLDREAVALARAKKGDAALKLARDAKDALVEGRVLHVLGRDTEALAAFERAGTPGALDRGTLLLRLDRPVEAARAFEDAGDSLRRALALERAKDTASTIAFEAAKIEDRTKLGGLLAKEREARAQQKALPPGVLQERARFALADVLDQLADVSERLSIALEKTGEKAKGADFAQGALDSTRAERETLSSNGDKFGLALAQMRGLEEREKRLGERVKALR
jgi:hypothetical protein